MGLPAPVPANLLGELMPAPVRVLDNQIAQPGKISVEEVPALTGDRFYSWHEYAMGGPVSPAKNRLEKIDLSSYVKDYIGVVKNSKELYLNAMQGNASIIEDIKQEVSHKD